MTPIFSPLTPIFSPNTKKAKPGGDGIPRYYNDYVKKFIEEESSRAADGVRYTVQEIETFMDELEDLFTPDPPP